MKVKRIKVQNVKAIVDQEINLNGATAILMGGNNKGKSTLLKALKDRLLKIKPEHIVRKGETNGLYIMEFTTGDRIEWEVNTTTRSGEKLTLISSDGNKTSAITEIVKWFAPSSFDIDKFLNATPGAQRKTLEQLLGLDLTSIDERYAKAVEERKDANRDVDRVALNLKANSIDEELPSEVIPTDDIKTKILNAASINERYDGWVDRETKLIRQRDRLREELKEIELSLDELEERLSDPKNAKVSAEDVIRLKAELEDTELKNQAILLNNKAKIDREELVRLRDIAHEKDMTVQDIIQEKDALIHSAKMPEGFGFTEEGITYNGLPLTREQLSSSAIYIAALKLASINVGNVRMLHFDASMLDNKSLQEVRAWAEGEDLQLCIELVERDGSDIRYELLEADDWENS